MEDCLSSIVPYVDRTTLGVLAQVSTKAYRACSKRLGQLWQIEQQNWDRCNGEAHLFKYYRFLLRVKAQRHTEPGWYLSTVQDQERKSTVITGSRAFALFHAKMGLRYGTQTIVGSFQNRDGQYGTDGQGYRFGWGWR